MRWHRPERYEVGSPPRVLAEYVDAWRRQDWYGLVTLTQTSWRTQQPDPYGLLIATYQELQPVGFLITGRGQIREDVVPPPLDFITFADVTCRIWYRIVTEVDGEQYEGEVVRAEHVARLVYEGADGLPRRYQDPYGSYGVNPKSLLDQDRSAADMRYQTSIRVG